MPRFHFHLCTPAGQDRDDTGSEFTSLEVAYLDVWDTIPAMSAEMLRAKANPFECAFQIEDPFGNLLMEVPFTERLSDRKNGSTSYCSERESARAEAARLRRLVIEVRAERQALRANLAETRRLLNEMRWLSRQQRP